MPFRLEFAHHLTIFFIQLIDKTLRNNFTPDLFLHPFLVEFTHILWFDTFSLGFELQFQFFLITVHFGLSDLLNTYSFVIAVGRRVPPSIVIKELSKVGGRIPTICFFVMHIV